jgi:hypothetical protein
VNMSSKKQRIQVLVTGVWLLLIVTGAIASASSYRRFDVSSFLIMVLLFGVAPPLVLWGIAWVMAAPNPNRLLAQDEFAVGDPLSPKISCPDCGAAMKLRTSRHGRYAGKVFWGCSRHPTCVRILPLGAAPDLRDA